MVFWAVGFPLLLLSQVQANPGYSSQGPTKLEGVPGLGDYSKLVYPHLDIQDGGSISHADLTKIIRVSDKAIITQPKPYLVHVPLKVPYPVDVPKPFPVHVPHFVKVPHPVPVHVIKKVPVPIEFPKPYPVPREEYDRGHNSAGDWSQSSYTASASGEAQHLAEDNNSQYNAASNNDAYLTGQYQGQKAVAAQEHNENSEQAEHSEISEH